MFVRTQTNGDRTYLIVVENQRIGGKIRQRVLHRLGRLDELLASGQLDASLASLGRFSDKYAVLGAHAHGESLTTRTRIIGPGLIFERLWQQCGIRQVLTELLRERQFEFPVERAVFLAVLHRLLSPGSDRAAEKWKQDYALAGVESLALHQLYRAMAWLGEPLPEAEQQGATPFAVRTNKDRIEEELFARRRDLFSSLGSGVLRHHFDLLRRRRWADPGLLLALQGSPTGPAADGGGYGDGSGRQPGV
jgi:hypothetical protein